MPACQRTMLLFARLQSGASRPPPSDITYTTFDFASPPKVETLQVRRVDLQVIKEEVEARTRLSWDVSVPAPNSSTLQITC